MNHPILQNPHQQMGFLSSFKEAGQNLVTKYIDEPLRDLGASVGLTDKEIEKIASETNKAYQKELQNAQTSLIKQVFGMDTRTQQRNMIADLQNQLTAFRDQLSRTVPGGMVTVYAVGGVLTGAAIYYMFLKSPSDKNESGE